MTVFVQILRKLSAALRIAAAAMLLAAGVWAGTQTVPAADRVHRPVDREDGGKEDSRGYPAAGHSAEAPETPAPGGLPSSEKIAPDQEVDFPNDI